MDMDIRRVGMIVAAAVVAVVVAVVMMFGGKHHGGTHASGSPSPGVTGSAAPTSPDTSAPSSTAAPSASGSNSTANDGANPSQGYGDDDGGQSAPPLSPDTGMGKQVVDYTQAMLGGDSTQIKSMVTPSYYQQTVGSQVAPNPLQSAEGQARAESEGVPHLDKSTLVMTESDQPGDTTHKVVLVHYRTCEDHPDGQRVCTPATESSYFYVKSGNQWLLNDVSASGV